MRKLATSQKIGPLHKYSIMKIRVLIVDDHQEFRKGLKEVINHQDDMEVVGVAENGEETVVLTRDLLPDIIHMDVIHYDIINCA